MNVVYGDKVRQESGTSDLLQQATGVLEEVVGRSAYEVNAEWDRVENGWRPRYLLQLSDWTGKVSADFSRGELRSASKMRSRFYELWGDLLQVRSHKLLDNLIKGSADSSGE